MTSLSEGAIITKRYTMKQLEPAFNEKDIENDLTYFRDKLKVTSDVRGRMFILKKIELLEDAAVIYHKTRTGKVL